MKNKYFIILSFYLMVITVFILFFNSCYKISNEDIAIEYIKLDKKENTIYDQIPNKLEVQKYRASIKTPTTQPLYLKLIINHYEKGKLVKECDAGIINIDSSSDENLRAYDISAWRFNIPNALIGNNSTQLMTLRCNNTDYSILLDNLYGNLISNHISEKIWINKGEEKPLAILNCNVENHDAKIINLLNKALLDSEQLKEIIKDNDLYILKAKLDSTY